MTITNDRTGVVDVQKAAELLDEFYAEHRRLVTDLGTIAGLATSLEDRVRDLDALIAEAARQPDSHSRR